MWKNRPLRLHTKTTLLASVISLAVLLAVLLAVNARMVSLVRAEERALAQLQAVSVAEQISLLPLPYDEKDLGQALAQAHRARPNVLVVRFWERRGETFVERLASVGSAAAQPIPADAQAALLKGLNPASHDDASTDSDVYTMEPHYGVFAPVTAKGRINGAVEVIEKLESVPSLVRRYAHTAAWLALLGVLLTTVAIYVLFRYLVYRPMLGLLYGMARAKAGSLAVQLPVTSQDEFGRLALGFNRMIERLRALTQERAAQQEILQQRVHEATAELQERNAQLAEANRELYQTARRLTQMERLAAAGQTAAQFAHEVGTPLNSISIHVELLRAALAAHPEAARRTEIIGEQLERIERIVRRMLDRTRLEEAVLQPLALTPLLEQICETTEPTLQARGVQFVKAFAGNLPLILGNADHLQQVFFNLINNALDAMPAGGVLELRVKQSGEQILVECQDTGCGMAAQTQARIFDPLYTTKGRGQGTGLGLVVAKQVMEEHGGSISVTSAPGGGANFCLRFPAAAQDNSETASAVAVHGAGKGQA
ncbi:MAG: HAMP domain-containing histidine kinase [Acidobacteria bacterium]|nr:HAMP domain-containing histidine kinase [Acidobacteriota bacterium]